MFTEPSLYPANLVPADLPYHNRDLSWLDFNYRVLQEASDPSVPLLERVKFFAIYSSNLDEFFRVRVANVRSLMQLGKKTKKELEADPDVLYAQIIHQVNKHREQLNHLFHDELIPQLCKEGICLLQHHELNPEQLDFAQQYFHDHLHQYTQPILLMKQKIRPFLVNAALYLAVHLTSKGKSESSLSAAVVKIPSDHLGRFIELPSDRPDRHCLMMLDDIVRLSLKFIFPGYEVRGAYSFKLSRDAELHIEDEYSGQLIDKIKQGLSKRNVGSATRFVYDQEMPKKVLKNLLDVFSLNEQELVAEGKYHNNFDFFRLPSYGKDYLKEAPSSPLDSPDFPTGASMFEVIAQKDRMLHFPYQSYNTVLRFFEEAATDPAVKQIRLTHYRVAKKSRIMEALKQAVSAGKAVEVFIEVKARFDEEANLQWAERLEAWGVKVLYSIPGLKVHSKLCLVTREEDEGLKHYTYLSTGNFNEDTARVYGDYGLFSADPRLTTEVQAIFRYLGSGQNMGISFQHLLVGQFNLHHSLLHLIEREMDNAHRGLPSGLFFKVNSVEEPETIARLYAASQAGVAVRMMVRGLCCLHGEEAPHSSNIYIRSIVDKYLEHARIYVFHNNGNPLIYLSSADLMRRNLLRRVECAFPIYDEQLRAEVLQFIETQWADNVKSRWLNNGHINQYVRDDKEPLRSQNVMYNFFKDKLT